MFVLNLISALLQAPLRLVAELLGLGSSPAEPTPQSAPPVQEVPTPLRARGRRRRPERRPSAPPAPPRSDKVKEVDEEPVLTAEFAEDGAEDGAGAELHVDEPWDGYAKMKVGEVKDRLPAASPAELGAIQLYEATHRNRKSVLEAVDGYMRG